MASPNSALAQALRELSEHYHFTDLPGVLLTAGRDLVLPVAMYIVLIGGSLKILQRIGSIIIPPAHSTRYAAAKTSYRKGLTRQAMEEWSKLKKFPPAYLSRACHEIYVVGKPKQGLEVLQEAKSRGVELNSKRVEAMQSDAQAIQHGNAVMVDMNARLTKQEYLGIATF